MTAAHANLRMRRTVIAGQYCDDDFCVYDRGLRIGRIVLHASTPAGPQWAWHVNPPVPVPSWCGGRCDTLEAAKTAFRDAWAQFKPTISQGRLRATRGRQDTKDQRRTLGPT